MPLRAAFARPFAIIAGLMLGACAPQQADVQSVSITLAPTQAAAVLASPVPPTIAPTFTATPTPSPTLTLTPSRTPSATHTPSITPTASPSPTLTPVAFFPLARPIAGGGTDFVDRSYPYGSTGKGNWEVHHGVEFQNPRGTPVLATAPGEVFFAGDDSATRFGPYTGYYGNLVVILHDFRSPDGVGVFTLYGHLDRVDVEAGARVETGQHLGSVGATGIALGPHLHFEVRLDDPYDFGATRNPEFWLRPYRTYGMIAGRLTDATGAPLPEVEIQIRRAGRSAVYRYITTYADRGQVKPDNLWGENFALGDVPAGDYDVIVSTRDGRVRYRGTQTVIADDIAWVEIVVE